jgi:hypothetical protein
MNPICQWAKVGVVPNDTARRGSSVTLSGTDPVRECQTVTNRRDTEKVRGDFAADLSDAAGGSTEANRDWLWWVSQRRPRGLP